MKYVSVILSFLLVMNLQCMNREAGSSAEVGQTSSVVEGERQLNDNNEIEAEPLQLTDIYYIVPGNEAGGLKLEEKTDFWDENAGVAAIGVSVLAVGALAVILHSSSGTSKAGAKAPHTPSSAPHVSSSTTSHVASHPAPAVVTKPVVVAKAETGAEAFSQFLKRAKAEVIKSGVKTPTELNITLGGKAVTKKNGLQKLFADGGITDIKEAERILQDSFKKAGLEGLGHDLTSLEVSISKEADGSCIVYAQMVKGDRTVQVKTITSQTQKKGLFSKSKKPPPDLHVVQVKATASTANLELKKAFSEVGAETGMVNIKGAATTEIQKIGSAGDKSIADLLSGGGVMRTTADGTTAGAEVTKLEHLLHNESVIIEHGGEKYLIQANRGTGGTLDNANASFSVLKLKV